MTRRPPLAPRANSKISILRLYLSPSKKYHLSTRYASACMTILEDEDEESRENNTKEVAEKFATMQLRVNNDWLGIHKNSTTTDLDSSTNEVAEKFATMQLQVNNDWLGIQNNCSRYCY